MKLSDYVVDFLVKRNIAHNFVVTGGAVVHLLDSTAKHPGMQHICVQHESSGAAAADGYSRMSGRIGLAMTTSGPGATNLTTSICNAYFDSIPLICITGQVARFRLRPNKKLRQKGFQETDIVSVFQSICKYVKLIKDPSTIRYELEKALFLAQEGRPGPVILDLPDDLQREEVDPETLQHFTPKTTHFHPPVLQINELFQLIRTSKKPLLILGAGVRVAKAEKEVLEFARYFHLPMALTWGGADLLTSTDPLNMGGIGVCGPRAGNFAAQNSDLIIAMGTRLSQQITGGKQHLFAPHAKKVMIDIDAEELHKFKGEPFALDLAIKSDLRLFSKACQNFYYEKQVDLFSSWRSLIQTWKKRYPLCTPADYKKTGSINPYVFIKELSKTAKEGEFFITDTGANICWMMQAFETKKDQRIISAWNHTPMGYALPASVGASLGSGRAINCLIGDGGLMMCVQELATIRRYDLPVKVFIFDNKGHSTMRQTLDTWLQSHYVAVDKKSGLCFPDYQKLSDAFELPYFYLENHDTLVKNLASIYQEKGPLICHLNIDEKQKINPILKFGSGLESLDPPLPQEELNTIFQEASHLHATELATRI